MVVAANAMAMSGGTSTGQNNNPIMAVANRLLLSDPGENHLLKYQQP